MNQEVKLAQALELVQGDLLLLNQRVDLALHSMKVQKKSVDNLVMTLKRIIEIDYLEPLEEQLDGDTTSINA